MRGAVFGTTYNGGVYGMGTVFKISASREKVIHNFRANGDGTNPAAALIAVNGFLYGTTEYGGVPGTAGTVFRISGTGRERVLYSFRGYSNGGDGANPVASLVNVKGTLYGTTEYGGEQCRSTNGSGTVFSISIGGTENVLHKFCVTGRYPYDGQNPVAGLTSFNGRLWGTTEFGGQLPYGQDFGDVGTVFNISTTGSEQVMYLFDSYTPTGCYPESGLTYVKGSLYGTISGCGMYGGGTVLKLHHPREPKLLHSFGDGPDGKSPAAPLLNMQGDLYGTTASGGAYGAGTVFSINPKTGSETVLHSFGYGTDGSTPLGGLIKINGALYGTTSAGGLYGKGTVFSLTP